VVLIRSEDVRDRAAVREVNEAAFPADAEARLVDAMRGSGALLLSLVAEDEGPLVGHIAFTPVTLRPEEGRGEKLGMGLTPMAVRPEAQRRGIDSMLVREGPARLAAAGHGVVVVLGHPRYYPRFGFVPAARHGIRWEHPAPDEAFLVVGLSTGGIDGVFGVVRFRSEFDSV